MKSKNSKDNRVSESQAFHRHLEEVKWDIINDISSQIKPLQKAFANYRKEIGPDAKLWDLVNSEEGEK